MASYLLLRDNKESGPFSIEDLLSFGLKPYDLIWVPGKSAAWRYPSEFEELKPFAPVVEEQPFDRFYKKNGEGEQKDERPVKDEPYNKYSPVPAEEIAASTFTPKKSVFVTLPSQDKTPVKKNVLPPPEKPAPTPIPSLSPIITITENPATAEIKFSQPLDEIKERYVKNLLDRKDKKAKRSVLVTMLKRVAVFGGLIAIGVLAGFIIRSKPVKNGKASPEMRQASSSLVNNHRDSEPAPDSPLSEEKSTATILPETLDDIQKNTPTEKAEIPKLNDEQQPTIKLRKETMLIVPKRKDDPDRLTTQGTEINSITGERERKTRDSNSEEISTTGIHKPSLKDFVSVSSNDYKQVAFGGIRNLYLTVTNKSKYELDHVIVELQYLKPSEEPLRTENIRFKSIGPNTSSTIKVPDTNRGIKIAYKIINIESKQNSDAVAGM